MLYTATISYWDEFDSKEEIKNITNWSFSDDRYYLFVTTTGNKQVRHSFIKSVEINEEKE